MSTDHPTIFVQIASYRDPECQYTVKDLFEKAEHPERVFVGVCFQYNRQEDHKCFQVPPPKPLNTVMLMIPAERSKGVCWARHQAQKLYEGEDYVLMIDSHMRFIQNWDSELIKELAECDSKKPILTTYPPNYDPPDKLAKNPMPTYMHAKPFDDRGNLRFRANSLRVAPEKPLRGAFIAGGFSFASGKIIKEVPYDPYLYFANEEACFAAKAFTHGWDTFSPTRTFVYHWYQANQADKDKKTFHWTDNKEWVHLQNLSKQRNDFILCGEDPEDKEALKEISKYGLGKKRTLAEYEKFCGVNFKKRKSSQKAIQGKFIKKLASYKPIELNPEGAPEQAQKKKA